MYTTVFLPPLGHAVTILLTWAQHEQLKQLRLESMVCVAEIVKPRCKGTVSPVFNNCRTTLLLLLLFFDGHLTFTTKKLTTVNVHYKYICLTSLTRAKCGVRSTLCWKIPNISGSIELFAL